MTPRPHGHGRPRRSNGWRGVPGYTCTSRLPMPRGSISWRSSSVPSLGLPSQVRGHTDACVAAYNATAHPFEWTTQVVCAKHFQVATYANECNHVLVYCLSNGFTTPGLRQNVFNCFGTHERLVVFVTESNELVDRFDQLRHALKDATRDSLARDLPNQHSTRFSNEGLAGITCR